MVMGIVIGLYMLVISPEIITVSIRFYRFFYHIYTGKKSQEIDIYPKPAESCHHTFNYLLCGVYCQARLSGEVAR